MCCGVLCWWLWGVSVGVPDASYRVQYRTGRVIVRRRRAGVNRFVSRHTNTTNKQQRMIDSRMKFHRRQEICRLLWVSTTIWDCVTSLQFWIGGEWIVSGWIQSKRFGKKGEDKRIVWRRLKSPTRIRSPLFVLFLFWEFEIATERRIHDTLIICLLTLCVVSINPNSLWKMYPFAKAESE